MSDEDIKVFEKESYIWDDGFVFVPCPHQNPSPWDECGWIFVKGFLLFLG